MTLADFSLVTQSAPPPNGIRPDWPRPLRVHVLGHFRVLKDDEPVRFTRRAQRKPLELLQVLIAFGGNEVGASALTDALWPDSEGDAAYHALESALYRLRKLLGANGAIHMCGSKISLDRRQFWVDLWQLERELACPRSGGEEPLDRLTRIRRLYEGHFLEQETERPWALKTRQLLRDRLLACVRETARGYEGRGKWPEAALVYRSGLELDPLAEDLCRGLMICHRELGDYSDALQAYRRCRELLARFLGVPPNAKTEAIHQSVRQCAASESGASGSSRVLERARA
jgi:DNA-binding SARP family transcriptional activator